MSAVTPLKLPSLTRADANHARVRFANREALAIFNGRLRLEVRTPAADGTVSEPVQISVQWGNETLVVTCSAELIRELLSSLDRGLVPDTLPSDLAGLLIEAALASLIEAWERVSGRDVAILRLERGEPATPSDGLDLRLSDVKWAGSARAWSLRVTGRPETVAALLAPWPTAPRGMDWLGLPAALRVGATRLPRRVMASLRPGDAVILEVWAPELSARNGVSAAVLVVAERWTALAGRATGTRWQLLEKPQPARSRGWGVWTMDGNDVSTAALKPSRTCSTAVGKSGSHSASGPRRINRRRCCFSGCSTV